MYHDKLSANIYSVRLSQKVHFICLQSADEVLMTQKFLFLGAAFFAGLNCNVKKKTKKHTHTHTKNTGRWKSVIFRHVEYTQVCKSSS